MTNFLRPYVLLLALSCLSMGTLPGWAATIYVDPTATEVGDGSIEFPYQTWFEVTFAEGNNYLQKAGTTAVESIVVNVAASDANPIYIGVYDGTSADIQGSIVVEDASNITFENLNVHDSDNVVCLLLGTSEKIRFLNMKIYHGAAGIVIDDTVGGNIEVRNCTIYETDSSGIEIRSTGTTAGEETIIANNTIYRNGLHGVQLRGNYCIVEDNEIHNNGISGMPGTSGVHLYSPDIDYPAADNNIIRRNRVSHQHDTDAWDGNGIQADHYCDNNEIYENVVFMNHSAGISLHDSSNNSVFDNILYGNVIDPGFTRPEKAEISLTSKSPDLDRIVSNLIIDNIVVAVNPDAVAIFADGETSDNTNTIGNNGLYHENGGDLWRLAEDQDTDLTEWNAFAAGGGDDYVYDPVAEGFTPPVMPPAYMLDDTYALYTALYSTFNADDSNILIGDDNLNSFTGAALNDTLVGNGNNDELIGLGGDDWLVGGDGSDTLRGGPANDLLLGGLGNDFIYGGDGLDSIGGGDGIDTIYGEADADHVTAGRGNDLIYGGDGNDELEGGPGDDYIEGGNGVDLLAGNEGNDTLDDSADLVSNNRLLGYSGNDTMTGGSGDDLLVGGPGYDIMYGGPGDDILNEVEDDTSANEFYGGDGADSIFGGFFADIIEGGNGNDVIDGGPGADQINGGPGDDVILPGKGADVAYGGPGADFIDESEDDSSPSEIYGEEGNDTLIMGPMGGQVFPGTGDDIIAGDIGEDVVDMRDDPSGRNVASTVDGDDTIYGGGGPDLVDAGVGNDYIEGNDGPDTLIGGPGADELYGGEGFDVIDGGPGNDIIDVASDSGASIGNLLFGFAGNDIIRGGFGTDRMYGGIGADTMTGGAGEDQLFGEEDDDTMDGGAGNDFLVGGPGNDNMIGGPGNDLMDGNSGNDTMTANEGDDAIDGGPGNDIIDSGSGSDILIGGPGDDTITTGIGVDFITYDSNSGIDTVTDFDPSQDIVVASSNLNGTEIVAEEDLLAMVSDSVDGAIVDLGGGHRVILSGITASQITADQLLVRPDPGTIFPDIDVAVNLRNEFTLRDANKDGILNLEESSLASVDELELYDDDNDGFVRIDDLLAITVGPAGVASAVYLDPTFVGSELGTQSGPFDSLFEAAAFVAADGEIIVNPSVIDESITISKPIKLISSDNIVPTGDSSQPLTVSEWVPVTAVAHQAR